MHSYFVIYRPQLTMWSNQTRKVITDIKRIWFRKKRKLWQEKPTRMNRPVGYFSTKPSSSSSSSEEIYRKLDGGGAYNNQWITNPRPRWSLIRPRRVFFSPSFFLNRMVSHDLSSMLDWMSHSHYSTCEHSKVKVFMRPWAPPGVSKLKSTNQFCNPA